MLGTGDALKGKRDTKYIQRGMKKEEDATEPSDSSSSCILWQGCSTNEYSNSQVLIIEFIIPKTIKRNNQVMVFTAVSSRSNSLLGICQAY